MRHVVVFSGPTLAREEVLAHLPDAVCPGPAARGDLYRASLEEPTAIVLLDGYFEHCPSVTHKEILWALGQGIPVFGAASMGALRAAELHQLGMVGCGAIFADLVAGRLEDDDEVAVVHTSGDDGYRAGSEAMVNLRATIAAAYEAGVVSQDSAQAFLDCAKALFYPDRDYARVLHELASTGHDRELIRALETWLEIPEHRVDQKRLDALEVLALVRASLERGSFETPRADWSLPDTNTFRRLREEVERQGRTPFARAVTEEVQLLGPEIFSEIVASASLRALAVLLDAESDSPPRPARRLRFQADFEDDERRMLRQMPRVHALVLSEVEPVLRALGDYDRVAARAAKKASLCGDVVAHEPTEVAEDIADYFRSVLRRDPPIDLSSFARSIGFDSVTSFRAAVRRELTFLRKLSTTDGA